METPNQTPNTNNILSRDGISAEWNLTPVADIRVEKRLRDLDNKHVTAIKTSLKQLGGGLMLQPVLITNRNVLVDGAHRLEAAIQSGWKVIPTIIVSDLTLQDRRILEIETNRVRKDFTMGEYRDIWLEQYEPYLVKAANENKARGIANLKNQADSSVMQNLHNRESCEENLTDESESSTPLEDNERISVNVEMKNLTGLSKDTMRKLKEIKRLAEDETQPENVRRAARAADAELYRPGVKVDPLYKRVMVQVEEANLPEMPKEVREQRDLEERLEWLVEATAGIARKLLQQEGLEKNIIAAAQLSQGNRDDLRSAKFMAVEVLARIVVLEAQAEIEDTGSGFQKALMEADLSLREKSWTLMKDAGFIDDFQLSKVLAGVAEQRRSLAPVQQQIRARMPN